jgi:hypothetical protein
MVSAMPFILIEPLEVFGINEGVFAARQFDSAKGVAVPYPSVQKDEEHTHPFDQPGKRNLDCDFDDTHCMKTMSARESGYPNTRHIPASFSLTKRTGNPQVVKRHAQAPTTHHSLTTND